MLATQKDLCCLIQPTNILSRNSGINQWLTNVCTNSDSSIVDCRPIENSNQRCNQDWSELNSQVEGRENRYSTARSEPVGDRPGSSIPDPINQALRTAVYRCEVHQINTIVFGCYRENKKLAPGRKARNQKFVQMPQAAKSSSFTAERRGSSGALTKPLSIKFFAVLSQKNAPASPFLSCGGVSKHQ
ncbi:MULTISPECIES: hypothetical protein [unclassified Microcoleus]|uniref:hypothetical protein n=1 Tax=unclassified Microcoleus TaxID=2642155 RepID=UPI002FD60F49